MKKTVKDLVTEVKVGDIIEFIYLSGSHPGDRRRVKIQEFSITKNKSHTTMIGEDLNINQIRRFMVNMMKDIELEQSESNNMISFIISGGGTISLYLNTSSYIIDTSHQSYSKILSILNSNDYINQYNELLSLANPTNALRQYCSDNTTVNNISIEDGEIVYNGQTLHNCLSDRILELYNNGYPFKPMLKFLENVMTSKSYRAINELYKFLEHKNLPITSDGCFIGYKKVRDDYLDFYTGTISNKIGDKPSMKREDVNDNCNQGCSQGYHIGTLQYAANDFHPNQGHVMLCKVNPKDVVSVPIDCNCQKVRVCAYEVIGELPPDQYPSGITEPVYNQNTSNYYINEYEDEYDEDEDEDENW